jgi:ubiquinone/menaquinone biosynthesis C-methylase UbiE
LFSRDAIYELVRYGGFIATVDITCRVALRLKDPAMSQLRQGNYPIERFAGEIDRLHIQGDALAADAAIMMDRIGVAAGWRCLDLGCGPRGVTDLLSLRVGPSGEVVGLDADTVFLGFAREEATARGFANIRFVEGDVYNTNLPAGGFDLVHSRFVASTAGEPEALLQEGLRLVRPGGILALQEPENLTLNCYPSHAAWELLKEALAAAFPAVRHPGLAQELPRLLRRAGLVDIQYRPFLVGFSCDHPMVDYVPATVEGVRSVLIAKNIIGNDELNRALAECRSHLAQAETVTTYHTVVQAWARKPSA